MAISRESIEIFCCYAHQDRELLRGLKAQLASLERLGSINLWHDADISPGMNWKEEIHLHLDRAQIILLLVSPDFMASDYCYSIELTHAMERHKRREVVVIPIILRPVHWEKAPFGELQALPTGAMPVTGPTWYNLDTAFFDIAEGIRKIVETMPLPVPPKKRSKRSTKKATMSVSLADISQISPKNGDTSSANSTLDNSSKEEAQAIKLFFCYTRADKKSRNDLDKHLRALRDSGQITTWFDREIIPGTDYRKEVDLSHIYKAEIVLLLISPDFINSGYLKGKEMEVAFYRKNTDSLPIISLMLRATIWRGTEISELNKLPLDGIPITRWQDRDEAFVNIVENLRIIFNKLLSLKQVADQSAIHQKWIALGWNKDEIIPVTEELLCPDGIGRYQHFAKVETGFQGTIFWHPDSDIGAHFIQGSIRKKWFALGWWEHAPIYPISDELTCSDGIGHYNHFRRIDFEPGLYYLNDISVYSHPTVGTYEVHGAIRHHWLSLGAQLYGYPTTDEAICPDDIGRISKFRNITNATEQAISWRQDIGIKMGPC